MPIFGKWAGALVCGAGLLAGCGTGPQTAGKTALQTDRSTPSGSPAIAALSPEELERRAEAHAYYAAAIIDDWNEDWQQAKENYFKAGESDPANESLVLEVSQRLLQLKDAQKALDLLTNAITQPTASGAIFAQLGRIQFMLGKKEEAIQSNRAALKKAPQQLSAYRNLAQIYLQDRQFEEGLKVLDQAARQPDLDANDLIELGQLYIAFLGAPGLTARARALDTFKRAAALNPSNLFQIQALADAFVLLGESDQAAEMYQKLLKHRPTLPGVREKLAGIYLRKQDRQRAGEQLRAILKEHPANPQANFLMGGLALDDKKYAEAEGYFKTTMVHKPDFEPVYYELAVAQLSQREPREALETLAKARDQFKESFAGEYYTALAFNQLKDYTNVINHLTRAEVIARASDETNRLNYIFYFHLGAAYERIHKYADGEKYLKTCIELSPDFVEALNYLGYMWAERGTNLAQAQEMINKALKKEPKNAAFLDSLGWVFYQQGKMAQALKYLLEAIANSEEPDATIYDHLGDVYHKLRQADKAEEAWRKALSLEPNPAIEKKLLPDPATKPASK